MPPLGIPISAKTVDIHIFDTQFRILNGRPQAFMCPPIKGFDRMDALAYSFLITHTGDHGKISRYLFDLGAPKNWKQDLPPPVADEVKKWERAGIVIESPKYMTEVLEENGLRAEEIDGLVWSHPHWDHIGHPSVFPRSCKLIIGPGIQVAYGPGWPENLHSLFRSDAFAGREVVELNFDNTPSLEIGGFKALDFFGDGSLYLLSAPGHAVGHINALARTTSNPDTFLLMAGDSYHHVSALRPSDGVPLPDPVIVPGLTPSPCPCSLISACHPDRRDAAHTPFVRIGERSPAIDLEAAQQTVDKLQAFDADDRILLISAHDWSLKDIIEYFPHSANDWRRKDWKQRSRWGFLRDFQKAIRLAEGSKL